MSHHPLRALSEKGALSEEEYTPLFAPDVTFHSPFLTRPVSGQVVVSRIFAAAFGHIGIPQYTLELTENRRTILLFDGKVKGYDLQGAIVITDNADGLVHELSVLLRPYPVVTLFWEAMRELAYTNLPKDFWELAPLTVGPPSLSRNDSPS